MVNSPAGTSTIGIPKLSTIKAGNGVGVGMVVGVGECVIVGGIVGVVVAVGGCEVGVWEGRGDVLGEGRNPVVSSTWIEDCTGAFVEEQAVMAEANKTKHPKKQIVMILHIAGRNYNPQTIAAWL